MNASGNGPPPEPRPAARPEGAGGLRLTRRRLLEGAAAASSVGLIPACIARRDRDTPPSATLVLARPRIEADQVLRNVAGLRPFRPGGYRLEAEQLAGKFLIHHYGHGGCGVTLSWGTASVVVELARTRAPGRTPGRAAVLGCGAVGLATARLLQSAGWSVTLYGRELPLATTSNVAGALWGPSFLADPEYRNERFGAGLSRALKLAHAHFTALPEARYGVRRIPVYFPYPEPAIPLSWDWALCPELFTSTAHAPGTHPFGSRYVHEFRLLMIETPTYLSAVLEDFRQAGGVLRQQDFRRLDDVLALEETLIVNCTGLGARALFGDDSLEPIKGQLTVLGPQPAVNYGVIDGRAGLYLLPRRDSLLLGGTHERGNWSTAPDPEATARILADHRTLFSGIPGGNGGRRWPTDSS